MRCPDCQKFVSYDDPAVDDVLVDIEDDELVMSGEVTLKCADCGNDLASASMEANVELSEQFDDAPDAEAGETVEYEMVEDPDVTSTDRTDTTDKTGKPLKSSRGARRYYGASASCTVKQIIKNKAGDVIADRGGEAEITIEAEEQASSFDSLV
jgi:hypothetical protein